MCSDWKMLHKAERHFEVMLLRVDHVSPSLCLEIKSSFDISVHALHLR